MKLHSVEYWSFIEMIGFLLYAEIHYTVRGIYSRLKKNDPEIIADVPHRIDPGAKLPVLILIKDANRFPIHLNSVQVEIRNGDYLQQERFDLGSQEIAEPFWHRVLDIFLATNFKGSTQIDVIIEVTRDGKRKIIKNDNYVASRRASFEVFASEQPLPKTQGWCFGEFHCHTSYTSDQVEFGAPLDASVILAQAMGLSFFCATDHSYDLDDQPYNYLVSDPGLTKWKGLQKEIASLNRSLSNFVIVPGEEVSVGNYQNRNVHLLILNHPEFLPGAGDGAEKWLQTRPDLSIAEVLAKINSSSAAFAAHPCTKPPFLEWLLLRRGSWQFGDCAHEGLHGLQIWNGTENGLQEGKDSWIRLLLKGRRVFISGGNDAHGNFNRFRQIGWPFLTMRENHHHLFGKVRTAVLLENGPSLSGLLDGFKNGRMVVTNGPFAEIAIRDETGTTTRIGGEATCSEAVLQVDCLSTEEFGRLDELRVYRGDLSKKKEALIVLRQTFGDSYIHKESLQASTAGRSYYRAELYSKTDTQRLRCLTNPIWLESVETHPDASYRRQFKREALRKSPLLKGD